MVHFSMQGDKELLAAFKKLPAAVSGKRLEDAVHAGARVLAQATEQEAARAFTSRSGRLLRFAGRIRVLYRSPAAVAMEVGPRVPYAHLVIRGHRIIARGSNKRTVRGQKGVSGRRARGGIIRGSGRVLGQVRGRPFPGPALHRVRGAITQQIRAVLARSIHETMALARMRGRSLRGD